MMPKLIEVSPREGGRVKLLNISTSSFLPKTLLRLFSKSH